MRIYKVDCIVGRIAIVSQRAVSCTSFPSHCHWHTQTRKEVHRESPYMYDTVQAVSMNSICTSKFSSSLLRQNVTFSAMRFLMIKYYFKYDNTL